AIAIDTPVLLVTGCVALLATLAFGTAAGRRGRSATNALAHTGHGDSSTRGSGRLAGGTLIATEIALSLVLGVMAVLMVRSVLALRAVDLGFDSGGVVMARVALPVDRYRDPASQRAFFDTLTERVRAVPGVESAGVASTRPFGGMGPATTVIDPRNPAPAGTPGPVADVRYVDGNFFRTLRIQVTKG